MAVKINSNIKSIRELKNLTQQYVAEKLGMTQAGYSKIEKGTTALTFDKLERIAAILEINIVALVKFRNDEWYCKGTYSDNKHSAKNSDFIFLCRMRREKIVLLEKLLHKTDLELKRYKEKFGPL